MLFDKIIDAALLGDIMVQLNVSFYNQDGDEVLNRCKIAKRYLSSRWFILDLVVAFPFDLVLSNRVTVNSLRLIKFMKLRKIPVWLNKLNISAKLKKKLKLLLLILVILILVFTMSSILVQVIQIHCFWFPIIEQTNP